MRNAHQVSHIETVGSGVIAGAGGLAEIAWVTLYAGVTGGNAAVLAGVWATNFFVILPIISPAFIHLVPVRSEPHLKVLFGLAAAEVLQWRTNSELASAMNLASLRCDKRR